MSFLGFLMLLINLTQKCVFRFSKMYLLNLDHDIYFENIDEWESAMALIPSLVSMFAFFSVHDIHCNTSFQRKQFF